MASVLRSTAFSFGPGAVGVVLSGALNDGTSGLWTIKRLGGMAIVQDPSMPRNALEYVDADYRVRVSEILGRLAAELVEQETKAVKAIEPGLEARIATKSQIWPGTGTERRCRGMRPNPPILPG